MDSSGRLLLELVNDTLELSRIESGKLTWEPSVVAGRDVIDEVVTALRPSAEIKGLTMVEDLSGIPDEDVWTDKLKLQKIFLNLISNAIKYTPEGGTVSVAVEALDPPKNGCNRRVVIEDTGIGIAPEFLPKLFEPFSQEQRPESANVGGTGLGLAIVKRIVDLIGGTITVSSEMGRGSRFDVELTIETKGVHQAKPDSDGFDGAVLAGRKMLMCEDNDLNAEIAAMLLDDEGIELTRVKNGADGVRRFVQSPVDYFDAILMDVRMPVMDGRQATKAIRSLERQDAGYIPIIALSADVFDEEVRQNLEAGMDACVGKPLNKDTLFRTLAIELAKRSD